MEQVIELTGVSTIYEGECIPAIRDINLKVKPGEFLAVIGPNGAGKTTLLETTAGLLEHTSGMVFVLGKDIKLFGNTLRKDIGYMPQELAVDELTPFLVKDVVLMGRFGRIGLLRRPSREDFEKALKALALVGIDDLQNRPIGKLSGGQLQKALIARVLAKEPKILLLDEPFSNLDWEARTQIPEMLSRLHDDWHLTTLLVTHDLDSIPPRCERIVVLNEGRIVYDSLKVPSPKSKVL